MEEKLVWVFFYGLYMDNEVLAGLGVTPERREAASLTGYEFRIASWGYLTRSERGRVYGIVMALTHDDLERLYTPFNSFLTHRYSPVPVLVETADGAQLSALCYVTTPPAGPVNQEYVEKILALAEKYAFPGWYVEHLAGFREHRPPTGRSNFDGRHFILRSNSGAGDAVAGATRFRFRQEGDAVWATYEGGNVKLGTLVARLGERDELELRFQQLTKGGAFKTGKGLATIETLDDGRLRLHESWEFTSGGGGTGEAVFEEVRGR